MSRGYPKYLYSKVENAVDNGHFVVRTVFPKGVFKIEKGNKPRTFVVSCLEMWETNNTLNLGKQEEDEDTIHDMEVNLAKWIKSQKHILDSVLY